MSTASIVYVVDDNQALRESLKMLLGSVGLEVLGYARADEFLNDFRPGDERPACLLLDVRMPGMSGMALLERLCADKVRLPVILITGHGDIDMAVRAMKLGAVDFLTKPFNSQRLVDLVQNALRQSRQQPAPDMDGREAASRLQMLTSRERQVFDFLVAGASNKAIAVDLGLSIRTVETHRSNIMRKLNARSLVDLVHLSLSSQSDR